MSILILRKLFFIYNHIGYHMFVVMNFNFIHFLFCIRDAAVRCRRLSQAHLEEVRARLMKTTQAVDEMLHASLARVEAQVASALNAEIRRLSELVDSYSRPFHPDPALIHVYKRELNTHVERELGRKLTEACSSDILNEVARCEQLMMSKFFYKFEC